MHLLMCLKAKAICFSTAFLFKNKLVNFADGVAKGLVLLGVFFCASNSPSNGQDVNVETAKPSFVIEKDVPIKFILGRYHVVVDLGPLPLGVTGVAKLRLINDHEVTLPVDEIELTCSCTSARISKTEIGPNSTATLEVAISTVPRSKRQVVTNSLNLVSKNDKSKGVSMVLRYSLEGLMAFTGTTYVQEVDPTIDRQTVLIPFLITEPVNAKDVSFEVSPATDGVVVDLVEESGERYAKLVFDPVFVPEDSMALTVTARNKTLCLSDTLPFLLVYRKHLEITPRTLRVRSEGDQLEASCLLRYRPPLNQSTQGSAASNEKEASISVEASIGNVKLDVSTNRLGRGIYRVLLKGPKRELQAALDRNEASKVHWHITAPDKVYTVESLISTDSFVPTPSTRQED